MNNLIALLKKNFHFILFFFLQIVCIIFIYNNLHYPHFAIGRVTRTITYPINSAWNEFTKHFKLEKENDLLIQQNIALLRENENNFSISSDSTFSKYVGEEETKMRLYDYHYANVIYNSTNKKHNYLILDKGSDDGVTIDVAVASAQGVVGVVCDVSSRFSTVMSILHPDCRISAKVMPVNQIGTVIWEDNNPEEVSLHDIPQHLAVNIGDSVFTSGFSNVFPKDIFIGIVTEKETSSNNNFLNIKLKLATNLNRINTVYLIENIHKNEIDSLKSNFKHE